MKFHEFLISYGKSRGNHLFYKDEEQSFTYGEALREVDAIRDRLSSLSLSGHLVALYFTSMVDQLFYFLAVEWAGGIPLLVHEYLKGEEIGELIEQQKVDDFISAVPFHGFSIEKMGNLYYEKFHHHNHWTGDMAVLTSGSSGVPKVFFRKAESWTDFFLQQNKVFHVNEESRLLFHGSLAFTGNLNMVMEFLSVGASVHGSGVLSPKTWMKRIHEEEISHVYMIPSKLSPLSKVMDKDEGLRFILTGSQLMTSTLFHRLKNCFPSSRVILYYGASELSYVSFMEGEEILEHPDAVGKTFEGVQVSIQNGEIMVDTPHGVEGITRPFTCHDLGIIDDEGRIHFLGRREDVYHIQGNHVSKQKVISHLLMVNGVEEAEILPLKKNDGDDRMIAFLAGDIPSSSEIVNQLSKKLCPWEIPHVFIKVSQIPRTSTGKTDRKKLKEMAGES